MKEALKTKRHSVDICVIGGGIGGMFTAISAARRGAKVALMHDRPVLGGNASSEIRMWISGAGTRVRDLQETGIMEELQLENMYRNPTRNYSTWDALLYEMVRFEENIDLILNCSCCDAETENGILKLCILQEPAVRVIPLRLGEWAKTEGNGRACSLCGYPLFNGDDFPYCPICGAKMGG